MIAIWVMIEAPYSIGIQSWMYIVLFLLHFALDFGIYLFQLYLIAILFSLHMQGWEWTCEHIVGQICECLESHLVEGFSAATIVLLGQLGR